MSGVADDGLIKISDFDFNVSLCTRNWTRIAQMTVAANPYGRPYRNQVATRGLKPFIEFGRVASDVGMRRANDFCIAGTSQKKFPRAPPREVCTPSFLSIIVYRKDTTSEFLKAW